MGFLLAIDIGAGQSTKIALCDTPFVIVDQEELSVLEYGHCFEDYASRLAECIERIIGRNGRSRDTNATEHLRGIGVATAGILASDGRYLRTANIPFLEGHNLKLWLEHRFDVPVAIDNDANAGGLAEWRVLNVELLYWVFGGGWGGAWISRGGVVRFPATDWTGIDKDLHPTSEPGYAIPLPKVMLRDLFREVGGDYGRLEHYLDEEFGDRPNTLKGPDDDSDSIRAEVILSGPGRWRLFRSLADDDDLSEWFGGPDQSARVDDPAQAGSYISRLSRMRVATAVNTDRLYGKILAHASRYMIERASADGLGTDVPICLGGRPSYALPYFGPSAQRALGRWGLFNYLRPSTIDERGFNANVVGAAVLAERAETGRTR